MNKRIIILLSVFFSFLLQSCEKKKSYENVIKLRYEDFNQSQSLVGTILEFDDIVFKPTGLQVFDTLLITLNRREEKVFHVFDLNAKRKIKECISIGQGPDEVLQPYFVNGSPNAVSIYDMATSTLREYSLEEFVNKDVPKPFREIKLSEKIPGSICGLLGNEIICSSYNPDYKFLRFNLEGKKEDTFGVYPISTKSYTNQEKLKSYASSFVTNNMDKIVVCYNWTDLIDIYNKNGELQKSIHGPEGFFAYYKEVRNNNVITAMSVKGKNRDAFFNPQNVGDAFFVQFHGKLMDEEGYDNLSNKILSFDWDGNPKQILSLDKGVFTFTVDKKNKRIYGITNRPEYQILEFQYE